MNVGNNSGSDEPEVMMEINTTPLIDVMLVLLVMLIITIPIQLHAVNIEMPVPAPQTVEKPETHKILIQKDGQIGVDGISVTAIELQQKMESYSRQAPQPVIEVFCDRDGKYSVFANILSTTKRLGLTRIAVTSFVQ